MGSGSSSRREVGSNEHSDSSYSFKTTSEDIYKEFGKSANGKTAIVTGGSSGIGFETVRILAKCNAEVILATKTMDQGAEIMIKILKEQPRAKIVVMQLDLSSFDSIWSFCNNFRRSGRLLHIIINNASTKVMNDLVVTEDNIESQFAINYLGHFLMTLELLDIMLYSSSAVMPGRIINVSCSSNYLLASDEGIALNDINCFRTHYNKHEKHAASKLAMILFTRELASRVAAKNLPVKVMSLHPGFIQNSRISRQLRSFSMLLSSMCSAVTVNSNCTSVAAVETTDRPVASSRAGALRALFGEPMKTVEQGKSNRLIIR